MFGKKRKKNAASMDQLINDLDSLHRQKDYSRTIGTAIMDLPSGREKLGTCLEKTGPIESCFYMSNPCEPPSLVYHFCEDEEAELFFLGDLAGRGTPPAFIAMYLKGFFEAVSRRYKISGGSRWVSKTLWEINDLLFEKKLQGSFAAVNVVIIWKQSGTAYLWSMAGCPFQIFRESTGELKQYRFEGSPALGVFPSDMLKMQGADASLGPKSVRLRKGDYLLIIDGGFENSLRPGNDNFDANGDDGESEPDEEPFGEERVSKVLHSALTGGTAEIPGRAGDDPWLLDMEKTPPSPRNTILCLAAAEMLFRIRYDKSTPSKGSNAEAPARTTAELMDLLQQIVPSKNLSVEEGGPEGGEDGSGKAVTISGYRELPLRDDYFALAIRINQ